MADTLDKTNGGYAALQTPRASASKPTDDREDMRNPLDRANLLSRVTLWWVNAAMRRGYHKVLEEEDVWDLPETDSAATLQRKFDERYAEDAARQRASDATTPTPIYRAMWHATKSVMNSAIFLHTLSVTATLLQPLLIKAVLQYLKYEDNDFGISSGYVLAALLTITAIVGVTALEYATYLTIRAGVNARMIVVNGVYQKILKLTSNARMSMNSGDIITFASVDSERLYEAYAYGPWAFIAPAMITAVCILIGVEMGALVALAAAVCSVAVLAFALTNARRIGQLRRQILEVAGERVKVTNEVLQGIRVIKMYAWEDSIAQRIAEIRAREIRLIRKYDYTRVANIVVLTLAQNLLMAACFVVYVYQGNELTAPIAFTLLGFTNALRMPFGNFSSGVAFTSEAIASMKRISNFMAADELTLDLSNGDNTPLLPGEPIVDISGADFSWVGPAHTSSGDEKVARPILRNINLNIQPGTLTIVVGTVGSGKSSLVSALLGEMEQLRGTRAVRGTVAYASQQAWIQHNTVRENILFGTPYDAALYNQVVAACQLTRDFEILEDGDATEIGERGINLSGGQKARVSLARVMYRRNADLVVLDDPLSALDVHVANAAFFECVKGLAASKTRLLVLNAHYHLLKHADRIIVLSEGEIIGDGAYDEVRTKFTFLEDQAHEKALTAAPTVTEVSDSQNEVEIGEDAENDLPSYSDMQDSIAYPENSDLMERMSVSSVTPRMSRVSRRSVRSTRTNDQPAQKKKALMLDEDRAVGSVSWRTYASFFAGCGFNGTATVFVVLFLFALAQGSVLGSDYFITYWSNGSMSQYSQETLLWMYVGIIGLATVLGMFRGFAFTEICIRASQALHARYFTKVLMAPINTFFDVTPVGRVLNRFSRDLDQIDNPIPHYALSVLSYGMLVLSIFVVCAVTTPTTLILYAPLTYLCFYVQKYFLASSRELKRLDGITRSPFLNLVAETINGIESIRSFRMTHHFSQKCRDLLDYNSKFFFMFQSAGKWLGMRLDWLMTSIVAVVSFTCVASRGSIGSASAGIALTYAVTLTVQFQRLITLATMTENMMTSYERIAYYGTLEEEGDTKTINTTNPPPADWPANGTIQFDNVFLRYRDGLDFVLRGVSFSVRDGEKIGVCGRTGSGKSTLMNALFRTVEAAQGVVRIDGVDIATVKLQYLRSKLTIIPQDPVLFSGTLRDNLDPFSEKSDEELFSALRKVHLIEDVGRWGQGLSYEVSEKGENLSVGQRQLICIARALLRESRIVVLDEATANVDQELDRLIQVAVKECFLGRTSLTIAHRLETIADSDRILVMEHGRVAEFDTPANLLSKGDGLFASLMKSTQH